jgi:hypothetical protein
VWSVEVFQCVHSDYTEMELFSLKCCFSPFVYNKDMDCMTFCNDTVSLLIISTSLNTSQKLIKAYQRHQVSGEYWRVQCNKENASRNCKEITKWRQQYVVITCSVEFIMTGKLLLQKWSSSVSIVTRLPAGLAEFVSWQGQGRIFPLHHHIQTGSGAHITLYPGDTRDCI